MWGSHATSLNQKSVGGGGGEWGVGNERYERREVRIPWPLSYSVASCY